MINSVLYFFGLVWASSLVHAHNQPEKKMNGVSGCWGYRSNHALVSYHGSIKHDSTRFNKHSPISQRCVHCRALKMSSLYSGVNLIQTQYGLFVFGYAKYLLIRHFQWVRRQTHAAFHRGAYCQSTGGTVEPRSAGGWLLLRMCFLFFVVL